jgi:hypothetical protein
MRYWGILAAKLLAAAAVLYSLWLGLHAWYEAPLYLVRLKQRPFAHDLTWTTIMFAYNLVCQGVLFLIVLDQKYRCRRCGRRLRMPVRTGSHARMLFLPPKTEYICAYGHGTLKVPEIELTEENSDWEPHKDDYWTELVQADKDARDRK